MGFIDIEILPLTWTGLITTQKWDGTIATLKSGMDSLDIVPIGDPTEQTERQWLERWLVITCFT